MDNNETLPYHVEVDQIEIPDTPPPQDSSSKRGYFAGRTFSEQMQDCIWFIFLIFLGAS